MKKGITTRLFGSFENRPVTAYTITNEKGMQVTVINYGATIIEIITPDKKGDAGSVILGFDSLAGYIQNGHQYHGCIVGRYANRIAGSKFVLDGTEYSITKTHGHFCLHGGKQGFDKVWWDIEEQGDDRLKLTYTSADGEEGFPGNLHIEMIYSLTAANELVLNYTAHTDKPTVINLTNHCYFNLSAGKEAVILNHELEVNSVEYTEADENLVPTGRILSSAGTALDFMVAKPIGRDIISAGGYDHNLIISSKNGKAAELYDPLSGRCMEMFTTEPAVQLYTGNALHCNNEMNNSKSSFPQYAGLCLEAQHYPNSPNAPSFPTTTLRPGEKYHQQTSYKFSVR